MIPETPKKRRPGSGGKRPGAGRKTFASKGLPKLEDKLNVALTVEQREYLDAMAADNGCNAAQALRILLQDSLEKNAFVPPLTWDALIGHVFAAIEAALPIALSDDLKERVLKHVLDAQLR